MLSKLQNKYIRSLSQHKFRLEYGVFIVEGVKIVAEWLQSTCQIQHIVAVEEWVAQHTAAIARHPEAELHVVKQHELESLSELRTPNQVLAVVRQNGISPVKPKEGWVLALDGIQDPGNMGTILRIADWFGIHHIVASPDSVDFYNPKVVQAAMGAHLRISLSTADLPEALGNIGFTKYAATLNGTPCQNVARPASGVLIIGNESKGISEPVLALADQEVTIPRGPGSGAESLNAAVAAGILCALLLPC
jgi:TrmH family RNA methyltransferase